LYLPPFKVVGPIFPPATCREHWRARLSDWIAPAIFDECYERISIHVVPRLNEILADARWLPVERLILESWRNPPKPGSPVPANDGETGSTFQP
jgi:hypothetical protein